MALLPLATVIEPRVQEIDVPIHESRDERVREVRLRSQLADTHARPFAEAVQAFREGFLIQRPNGLVHWRLHSWVVRAENRRPGARAHRARSKCRPCGLEQPARFLPSDIRLTPPVWI